MPTATKDFAGDRANVLNGLKTLLDANHQSFPNTDPVATMYAAFDLLKITINQALPEGPGARSEILRGLNLVMHSISMKSTLPEEYKRLIEPQI